MTLAFPKDAAELIVWRPFYVPSSLLELKKAATELIPAPLRTRLPPSGRSTALVGVDF